MAINISTWVLSFLLLLGCVRGFNMKLIPRDSHESPLYEKNLTHKARFEKMVNITISRTNWLKSSGSKLNKDTIQPTFTREYPSYYYMVSLSIGTPEVNFYLMVDTGCAITWVQAHACTRCFPVMDGSFNFNQSSSFVYLPCDDDNCISCDYDYDMCEYRARYGQDAHSDTRGLIAKDDFTFLSDTGGKEKIRLLFGVGLKNGMNFGEYNKMVGIFGLASGEYSILSQLPYSMRRFSYCLPPDYGSSSTIKFGESVYVPRGVKVQTTPLIVQNNRYWLNCIGISVNGKNIGLPKKAFASGFLIDSGTPFTQLVPGVYNLLRNVLSDYFKWFHKISNQGLCYLLPSTDFDNFPTITFHFQASNFTLRSEGAFNIEEDVFCLAIISTEEDSFFSTFGARSQVDHVIIHDINKKQLSFFPEDCS